MVVIFLELTKELFYLLFDVWSVNHSIKGDRPWRHRMNRQGQARVGEFLRRRPSRFQKAAAQSAALGRNSPQTR
jgi:hypothetical protein